MIKYTSLTIFVWILALLNSFMDKRKSAFNYPEWHKEFIKGCDIFSLTKKQILEYLNK